MNIMQRLTKIAYTLNGFNLLESNLEVVEKDFKISGLVLNATNKYMKRSASIT